MFARRFLLFVGFCVTTSVLVFGLSAVAKYKPYGVPDALRDQWEAKQEAIAAAQAARASRLPSGDLSQSDSSQEPNRPLPLAVIDDSEHDFGLLDPGQQATHSFEIRNEGDAPLALTSGETSCKCTLSETSRELVPPGESANITLTWNTGSEREFYRQYALVRTNDPEHPEIELAVSGKIRVQLGFDSDRFFDPQVDPGSGAKAFASLYSQTLDTFHVGGIECDLPGFRSEVFPLDETSLTKLGAKSGYRVEVSTSAALDPGSFASVVRVSVDGAELLGDDAEAIKELSFEGYVRPSISFYGPGLDSREGLDLGIVSSDQTTTHTVYVRVRGNPLPEKLEVSSIEPEVLQASIQPLNSRTGVFALKLTIPAGAEQAIFNRDSQHGYVEVRDAENPNQKNWFPVRGAVIALKKN